MTYDASLAPKSRQLKGTQKSFSILDDVVHENGDVLRCLTFSNLQYPLRSCSIPLQVMPKDSTYVLDQSVDQQSEMREEHDTGSGYTHHMIHVT